MQLAPFLARFVSGLPLFALQLLRQRRIFAAAGALEPFAEIVPGFRSIGQMLFALLLSIATHLLPHAVAIFFGLVLRFSFDGRFLRRGQLLTKLRFQLLACGALFLRRPLALRRVIDFAGRITWPWPLGDAIASCFRSLHRRADHASGTFMPERNEVV